jgi:hypothetical protein
MCLACTRPFYIGKRGVHVNMCRPCITQYLLVRVAENQIVEDYPCPCCEVSFTFHQLQNLLPADALSKIERSAAYGTVHPKCHSCGTVQKKHIQGFRAVDCTACSAATCLCCGESWHSAPCWIEDNDQRLVLAVSPNGRRCPKCRYIIEKTGGCEHMTCINCHYEFAWCCREAWRDHQNNSMCCYSTNNATVITGLERNMLIGWFFMLVVYSFVVGGVGVLYSVFKGFRNMVHK